MFVKEDIKIDYQMLCRVLADTHFVFQGEKPISLNEVLEYIAVSAELIKAKWEA
jgi:hypothetical protein